MFDKHDVTTKKLDVIVEKAGKVDANYAAQIEGYCSLLGEYGKKFETVCAMLALDRIGIISVIGALKYSDEIGTLFKNADKVSVVARSTDGTGVLAKHADEAGAWLHGVKVFRYSDETAEAVASGEKLLKESGTIYESFADMMSPDDAAKYLDFLENGSREGLTSAELAGVEKADALLVSQKVGYEDVWDLRNAGDVLESGRKSKNPMTGGDWHNYFNENYGADNVTWESASIQDIIDMPSKITDFSPKQISNLASRNGWTVEPLGKGRLAGIPYEQGGGISMHAPNGSSIYIQYHPGSGHHGVMPYYKISSGKNGIVRYYINGERVQ